MENCTCCCLDCVEGVHCGGACNDHGTCLEPMDRKSPYSAEYWDYELSNFEDEDEDEGYYEME
jgi:hypothetical protein